jgi:hypothetical protein
MSPTQKIIENLLEIQLGLSVLIFTLAFVCSFLLMILYYLKYLWAKNRKGTYDIAKVDNLLKKRRIVLNILAFSILWLLLFEIFDQAILILEPYGSVFSDYLLLFLPLFLTFFLLAIFFYYKYFLAIKKQDEFGKIETKKMLDRGKNCLGILFFLFIIWLVIEAFFLFDTF